MPQLAFHEAVDNEAPRDSPSNMNTGWDGRDGVRKWNIDCSPKSSIQGT